MRFIGMDVPGHAMSGCTAHDETGALIAISLSCECGGFVTEARMDDGVIDAMQRTADSALLHIVEVAPTTAPGRATRYVGLDAFDGDPSEQ